MCHLEVGSFVVYPAQGVGRVCALVERRVAGLEAAFFLVRMLDTHVDVWIPADRCERIGLRHPVDAQGAGAVMAVFDGPIPQGRQPTWIQRCRKYEQTLVAGRPCEVALVLRDLYVMKLAGQLSFGQFQLLERSRRIVVNELALALDREPAAIERALLERVRRANPQVSAQ
jgi:CarD family transcriptional regulator